jgi:vacuolar-type H+-ATPase subunit H
MTKIGRFVVAALVLGALVVGLSGCKKKEGTAEKAGKEIDKAVEKSGQEINKAVNKTGEKIEQAGEKLQDAAKGDKK